MQSERLQRMIRIAMLGALGFLLMYFGEIHIPPFADFLKYDPGDVPALIAGYTLGPAAGVGVQTIKALLFWASGKSTAGWVGVLANFLAGCALVVASSLVQRSIAGLAARSRAWELLSAGAGTVVMSAILIPVLALLVYPLWGMTGAAAWEAALFVSTPFNLFKGFLSSAVSLALYRRLAGVLAGQTVQRAA
jgi:riboflavin transporter FmnP